MTEPTGRFTFGLAGGLGIRNLSRRPFVRDVGTTFGATLVTVAAGAIQAILIARGLGPSGKGVVALVTLVPNLLSPMLASGYAASCVYFATRAPIAASVGNATTIGVALVLIALMIVGALRVTGALDSLAPDVTGWFLVVAIALLPLTIAQNLYGSLLVGLGRLSTVNALRTISAIATLGATAVVLSAQSERKAEQLVGAQLIVFAAVTALYVRSLRRVGAPIRFGIDNALLRGQLHYAVRDHPGTVLQFLNYRLDQMFVSAYRGAAGVGLYSVAVTMAELLWLVPNSIAAVVFPKASRERAAEGRRATVLTALASFALACVGAIALAFLGKAAIRLAFSASFETAYSALVWLLPGAVLLAPTKILAADIAGRGFPIVNSFCAAVGLIVTVTFDLALIPSRGIRGAAMASTLAYVCVSVLVVAAFVLLPRRAIRADEAAPK